jgi:hypothetical protein
MGVLICMPNWLNSRVSISWDWRDHFGITGVRISILKARCEKLLEAFGQTFGGRKGWILLLHMHLHDISTMQKINVTKGLRFISGLLTITPQAILSMDIFTLILLTPLSA